MKIVTAIAVIASILVVGWTRNRLIKYERSIAAQKADEVLPQDNLDAENENFMEDAAQEDEEPLEFIPVQEEIPVEGHFDAAQA